MTSSVQASTRSAGADGPPLLGAELQSCRDVSVAFPSAEMEMESELKTESDGVSARHSWHVNKSVGLSVCLMNG